jgi:predicted DNA-binding transcriptional regulator AlpA
MTRHGDTLMMSIQEFREAEKENRIETIQTLKEDLNLNFWEQFLDVQQVATDLGVSKSTVYNWKNQEITPMPFKGAPERITRREAREWFNKYSHIYTR